MSWTVEEVPLEDIKRRKTEPNYGFVEQGIAGGTGYRVAGKGNVGHFIVASNDSLVPGFVVELALPELAVQSEYDALAEQMNRHSQGVLWFDSSDRDACDFAWRLGVALRSGPPLFVWKGLKDDVTLQGFDVEVADKSTQHAAVELLTMPPAELGGQTKEAAMEHIAGRCVLLLRKDKDVLGAAITVPVPGPYAALTSVVMDTYSDLPADTHEKTHRDLELVFMNWVAREVRKQHRQVVYSISRASTAGYLEAIKLNMTLVKQSFLANLSVRVHGDRVMEPV